MRRPAWLWRAAYSAALRVVPARLRREHGDEMRADYDRLIAEALASRGLAAGVRRALRELTNVMQTGLRLRASRAGRKWSGRGELRTGERRRRIMDRLWSDVRYAVRSWSRSPGLTAVAVLTLALAIGANTSIFSVVDAMLLERLPYADADELVMVYRQIPQLGWSRGPVSFPNYADWRRDATSFADMAAFRSRIPRDFRGNADVEQIPGSYATSNMFSLLGVRALIGRTLTESDGSEAAADVIVLSESLWRRRYGGDAAIIGRAIDAGGRPRTVVGVMAAGFDFPSAADEFWLPLRASEAIQDRDTNYLQVVARLAAGTTIERARAEMVSIFDRMRVEHPQSFGTSQPTVETRREVVSGEMRPTLVMLSATVGLLLLVACANLANLILIRATARGRELAVRSAIGAERGRLVRQLVTESAILALIGGIAGILLAAAGTRLLLSTSPLSLPRQAAIGIDMRALAFTVVLCGLCVLLFGLLPALRVSRQDANGVLRDSTTGTTGRRTGRLQRALVVAQLALAFVLLTGAGLLVNSFARLIGRPSGFDPEQVISLRLAPPTDRYPEAEHVQAYFAEVLERVRALPGVTSAGAMWALPFGEGFASGHIVPEGEDIKLGEEPSIGIYPVLGDYFATMRIPLVSGRLPGLQDGPDAPEVVAVNEAAAARFWPGQDPIGKRFRRGSVDEVAGEDWITVVGVVGTAKRAGLDEEPSVEGYWSYAQSPWAREIFLVARTDGDPLQLVDPIRAQVRTVDPLIPLTSVRTMSDRVSLSVSQPRFRTFVVSAFASVGGLLALIGIYGVMAFAVVQRTREIGVRMALGAARRNVLAHVLGQGARLIVAGLVIGISGAIVASRIVEGLLFEIDALDAPTYAAVAGVLAAGAALACIIPANRASRVDPLVAFRED